MKCCPEYSLSKSRAIAGYNNDSFVQLIMTLKGDPLRRAIFYLKNDKFEVLIDLISNSLT